MNQCRNLWLQKTEHLIPGPFSLRENTTFDFNDNSSDNVREKEIEFVNFVEGKNHQINDFCFDRVVKEMGRFVIFSYEGELYPGQIVSFKNDELTIKSMRKSLKMWKWPILGLMFRDQLNPPNKFQKDVSFLCLS